MSVVPFDRGRLCVPGVPARSDSFTGPKGSPRSDGPFITQSLLLPMLPHLFSSRRGCPLVSGISPSVLNGLSAASSQRCLIEKIRSQIASKILTHFLGSPPPCHVCGHTRLRAPSTPFHCLPPAWLNHPNRHSDEQTNSEHKTNKNKRHL